MSAKLLYLTSIAERAQALDVICVEENYSLNVMSPDAAVDHAAYDLIFCDADCHNNFKQSAVPVVAVYDPANAGANNLQVIENAIDLISLPFQSVETVARLRSLSRLHMLQDELSHRKSGSMNLTAGKEILLVSPGGLQGSAHFVLQSEFDVECVDDDMTGLLRAAQGHWSAVILNLDDQSRDPAPLIRQMRVLDRTRSTPILIVCQSLDTRSIAALHAGANDVVLNNRLEFELLKRVKALAKRKAVLDALREDAASIAPLTDFDHATGLPGPTQLRRSMATSLDRLMAQNKPVSLLLIALDPIEDRIAGEPAPDHVMLALTQVLRRSLRGFDFACRFGLDCFAILMPGADANGAEAVAQRICAEIKSEKVRLKDGRKDGTTASVGVSTMMTCAGAASAEDMIAMAMASLLKARSFGPSQVVAQELKLAA